MELCSKYRRRHLCFQRLGTRPTCANERSSSHVAGTPQDLGPLGCVCVCVMFLLSCCCQTRARALAPAPPGLGPGPPGRKEKGFHALRLLTPSNRTPILTMHSIDNYLDVDYIPKLRDGKNLIDLTPIYSNMGVSQRHVYGVSQNRSLIGRPKE